MEEVGRIITVPIKDSEIWSGMKVLLCQGSKVLDIVNVDHITIRGDYYVIGDSYSCELSDDMYLADIYAINKEKEMYKIVEKQWPKLIKSRIINSERAVIYNILPSTFEDGYINKQCNYCGCYFAGSKKQKQCKDCSDKDRYAQIQLDKLPKPEKRRRIIISKE